MWDLLLQAPWKQDFSVSPLSFCAKLQSCTVLVSLLKKILNYRSKMLLWCEVFLKANRQKSYWLKIKELSFLFLSLCAVQLMIKHLSMSGITLKWSHTFSLSLRVTYRIACYCETTWQAFFLYLFHKTSWINEWIQMYTSSFPVDGLLKRQTTYLSFSLVCSI